jgi:hypothetical protein
LRRFVRDDLELAGGNVAGLIATNHAIDSRSLISVLNNTATNDPDWCVLSENFGESVVAADAGRAVRNSRYKLIQYRTGTNELYDLLADSLETTNLLARTLNMTEQSAYGALTTKSDEWQSRTTISSLQRSSAQFSAGFMPVQHFTYTLERRSNVSTGLWSSVATTQAPSSDAGVRVADTNAIATGAFYRVKSEMP